MKTKIIIFLLLGLLNLIFKSNGKKIIAVEFFGSKSHVITYLGLLEELSRRGHQVTLVSPVKNFAKAGIKEVFTLDITKMILDKDFDIIKMKEENKDFNPFPIITKIHPPLCVELYDRPEIKALMNESWDLVILQPMFNECSFGFIYKILERNKCPLILFSPLSAPNFLISPLGGYHPPSSVPNMMLALGADMNLWERMKNFGMEVLIHYMINYQYTPVMESVYRQKVGADTPSAREILGSASILLSNGHFSLTHPKPNYPDIIEIGGIHSHPAKPLPKDLEEFAAGSREDGFIYFSFGSIIPVDGISEQKRNIFFNVFAKLKQRIIWKYDGEEIKNISSNIKLSKWLPQQDVLGHPKCKIFITHCGMGGIEEAIYHGVPMLGIPFYGDQPLNAMQAEKQGILLPLDWNELTEKSLEISLNALLKDPKYQKTIKELSSVFRDQIDKPLDRALWWTEYVMRHNGAPHIKSPGRKLNFFQYHSLDVLAIFFSITLIAVLIFIQLVKIFMNLLFGVKNAIKKKEE